MHLSWFVTLEEGVAHTNTIHVSGGLLGFGCDFVPRPLPSKKLSLKRIKYFYF
jgi:hypothetical protein